MRGLPHRFVRCWDRHDLSRMVHTQARYLADEALGRDPDVDTLTQCLRLIIDNGQHGWAVLLGPELVDRRTPAHVHRLLADAACSIAGPGLARVVERASRARLDADHADLLRAGREFEEMGFVLPAVRCYADVLAQVGDAPRLGRAARTGIVRQWRVWDGPAPVCSRDLPGLPPHDVAVRAELPPSGARDLPGASPDTALLAEALDLDIAELAEALRPRA